MEEANANTLSLALADALCGFLALGLRLFSLSASTPQSSACLSVCLSPSGGEPTLRCLTAFTATCTPAAPTKPPPTEENSQQHRHQHNHHHNHHLHKKTTTTATTATITTTTPPPPSPPPPPPTRNATGYGKMSCCQFPTHRYLSRYFFVDNIAVLVLVDKSW